MWGCNQVRLVVQRVSEASVEVAGAVIGEIKLGLLVLLGFERGDTSSSFEWTINKLISLRIFADGDRGFERTISEVQGSFLIVSQFTLLADIQKGRRPDFARAAPPDEARKLYEDFLAALKNKFPGKIATGEFGAEMRLRSVNEGPVTVVVERGGNS